MFCRTTFIAISLVSFAASVHAQSTSSQPNSAAVAPQIVAPGYYPGYVGRSSTLQEGVQHGYADVLRAEGEQAFNMARAADEFENARQKWLANRSQAVRQYFELQETNRACRKAQASRPANKSGAYAKVSHASATPVTATVRSNGAIVWPAALETSAARDARLTLEKLFEQRATGNDVRPGSPEYRQGCDAIGQLDAQLKASVGTLSAADYMAAKKMLQGLKQVLGQPADALLTQN